MPPAPSLGSETATNFRSPFPFTQKANVLDRDRVFVPAGWDSTGKIAVVRDGFDEKMWREAWGMDLENVEDLSQSQGASKTFAELVPDLGPKVSKLLDCLMLLPDLF